MEGAELSTVEALNDSYIADAHHVYAGGKRTESERATARVCGALLCDKSGVWSGPTRLVDVDLDSFQRSELCPELHEDKYAVYDGAYRLAIPRESRRSLQNEAHWVGDGILYWRSEKLAPVSEPLHALGTAAVRNGSTVYFENAPL